MFLVDANVLSEPTKSSPDRRVLNWLRENEHSLVVDPVIIGEVRFGILLLDAGKKKRALEAWFADVVPRIDCIFWDAEHGVRWAELLARLRRAGHSMPIKDSLIATTALVHGLTVATRNTADLVKAGVTMVNPFSSV